MKKSISYFSYSLCAALYFVNTLAVATDDINTTASIASSVNTESKLLQSADLQADFALLRRAYETLHPGLRRYNTPAQLDQHFKVLQDALSHDQTLQDAYLRFSEFTAKIKCGHSYPNFFNQRKAVAAALFDKPSLPFTFRWVNQRMVITQNFSDDARLVAGTEVESVNGVTASKILQRLLPIARADGSNDAKRRDYLQLQGDSKFEAFDVYYPMYFPSSDPKLKLVIRLPGAARTAEISVTRMRGSVRLARIKWTINELTNTEPADVETKDAPAWKLETQNNRYAVLRMPTWALYNSKWDWKAFLKNTFDDLNERAVPNLVIDLRGNEGGDSVGNEILSHLIDRDLPLPLFQRQTRYRKVPDDLSPVLDTWDPSFKDWGDKAIDLNNGFFRMTRYDDDANGDVIKPALPRYRGKVFVIVGATNSSATFEFAQQIQRFKLGKLVGQTTGGNQRGINGGAFFFLRLPKSGIEIDLPLIAFFPQTAKPDAGLNPDIAVPTTAANIARGLDAEMAAIQKIKP